MTAITGRTVASHPTPTPPFTYGSPQSPVLKAVTIFGDGALKKAIFHFYLFIGCAESSLLQGGLFLDAVNGGFSSCAVKAFHRSDFSWCRAQALVHTGFSGCGSQA